MTFLFLFCLFIFYQRQSTYKHRYMYVIAIFTVFVITQYSRENYIHKKCLHITCFIQNKPHSAIQKFREALDADFSYLLPLYNIATQYRQLGLKEAELEALNLLVTVKMCLKLTHHIMYYNVINVLLISISLSLSFSLSVSQHLHLIIQYISCH